MTSREKILNAVRQGKPEALPLPEGIGFPSAFPSLTEQFATVLQAIGGTFVPVGSLDEVGPYLQQHFNFAQPIVNLVEGVAAGNVSPVLTDDPHQFDNLHLVLLRARIGVAENGAVWVEEQDALLRVLPFIPLHLAAVLREEELVGNMHEAYRLLSASVADGTNPGYGATPGFGVFIAGPSKTADIEQSLVIGAHGPKSMTVFVVK
jgi:L-lactate dehydrogenase complex protein LldG